MVHDKHLIILLLLMLQFKHLVIDWCWQPEYEWENKGTYGHWGGILHSLKNAVGTSICFLPFVGWNTLLYILLIDYVIHYHVDWSKMNINRVFKLGPLTHPQFWWLTGFDQFLHQVTYLFLIWRYFPN